MPAASQMQDDQVNAIPGQNCHAVSAADSALRQHCDAAGNFVI
jgi:hypothetical protein